MRHLPCSPGSATDEQSTCCWVDTSLRTAVSQRSSLKLVMCMLSSNLIMTKSVLGINNKITKINVCGLFKISA